MTTDLDHDSVAALVRDINAAGAAFADNDTQARGQLLRLAQRLAASVELPSETVMRVGSAEPARLAHCKVAVDLKLFEHLKQKGSQGVSSQELADASGAETTLIARIMRHLAAMNVVDEVGEDKYVATRLSNAFTEDRFRDGISYVYDVVGPPYRTLPTYLKQKSYQNPTSLFDGPFQYAHQTQHPFFQWLQEHPTEAATFNNFMAGYRAGQSPWMDFYPVPEQLLATFDASISPALIVDVGGGKGHDLIEFHKTFPDAPGTLVLQDQASVIAEIADAVAPIQPTAHDFFTPQPVKHARVYHLHSVLHDWGDDQCVQILSNIVPAMKQGYSSVFIFEIAVPPRDAPSSATSMDWIVSVLGGMSERSLTNWEGILEKAGLKLKKVWTSATSSESLLEAELA